MKTVYMVVGCPGSGKSWVCEQLRESFHYVPHDAYMRVRSESYFTAIMQASETAIKPLLIETPFSMSLLLTPLRAHDFRVECVFIQEAPGVIEHRYLQRDGKPIPVGHLARQRTYLQRAVDTQSFHGTSATVLSYLKNAAPPQVKQEKYPWNK